MKRSREELIAHEVKAMHPSRVLEIAYAHSPNRLLGELGGEVHGIDPLARAAPFASMTKLDVNKDPIPFPDGHFDVVTSGCLLGHVAKPLSVLAEIHRVLKPSGTLILMAPNPHYYWEVILNLWYQHFVSRVSRSKRIEHFFEFSRYTMRTSLERTGFAVEKELGATFQLAKLGLRMNVEHRPGLAYEIIYVARKTGTPASYTIIEDDAGTICELPTPLFT